MANSKSALKRIQINERNRQRNNAYKTAVRTSVKKVHALVEANAESTDIEKAFQLSQSLIDRAVSKKLYKKNKGDRDKARLAASISKAAQA
jgi:small subunit ribosomal protein S20